MMASLQPADRIRWLSYRNDAGEEIPAFALVRPTGATTDGTLTVGQPTSDGQAVMVNGPVPCPSGGYGVCTPDAPVFALYDSAATPAAGQTWGAANGSWKLTSGKKGWTILGGNDTTRTLTLADKNPLAGPTLSVATNVCPIRSSGGVVTGLKVERRTVYLPAGTVVGDPACQTNPATCCTSSGSGTGGSPGTVWTTCCPDALPAGLHLAIGGDCAGLTGVAVSLTYGADPLRPGYWYGSAAGVGACGPVQVWLGCGGGVWGVRLSTNGGFIDYFGASSLTCDPLEIVFSNIQTPGQYIGSPCCGVSDTISLTFTAGSVPPIIDDATGLACCDVALPVTLTLTLPDTSEVTLTYDAADGKWKGGGEEFFCGDSTKGAFGMIILSIAAVPVFDATCDPPYWEWHDGSDVYTVTE